MSEFHPSETFIMLFVKRKKVTAAIGEWGVSGAEPGAKLLPRI